MLEKDGQFQTQLEIGLGFVRCSFAERNNCSEGSSEPKKDAQVIRVWGAAALRVFFNSNYLLACKTTPTGHLLQDIITVCLQETV